MKHTKHILSLVLCLVMLLGVGLVPAYAGLTAGVPNQGRVFTYKKLSYQISTKYSSDVLTCLGPAFYISKDGKIDQYIIKDMVVPNKVGKLRVSYIDYDTSDSTAKVRNALQSLSIPDNVTKLSGFKKCKNLKTVTGGKNVRTLTDGTFAGTAYKTAAVKKNKYGAFYFNNTLVSCNGKIRTLVIKEGTTIMLPEALKHSKVESITFPKTLKEFGNGRDKDYDGLSAVWIDSQNNMYTNLKEIKVSKDNPYYTAKDGVLYSKDMTKLIWYPRCKEDRVFTVPATVTWLGKNCFYNNSCLYSLKLPDNLKKIGPFALGGIKRLKALYFPPSIESIDYAHGGLCETTKYIADAGSVGDAFMKKMLLASVFEKGDYLYCHPCETHSYQTVKGEAPTACSYGYSDYQQCTVCGMIEGFKQLAKTGLPKKAVTLAGGKGSIKVKVGAVAGATGFDVCYTKDGKTTLQSFVAALPDTQTISKLPAGTYKVKVRVSAVVDDWYGPTSYDDVIGYSAWTAAKTVKVK